MRRTSPVLMQARSAFGIADRFGIVQVLIQVSTCLRSVKRSSVCHLQFLEEYARLIRQAATAEDAWHGWDPHRCGFVCDTSGQRLFHHCGVQL